MRSDAEAVVRDVAATTSLHVELSIYPDPDNGICAVVHEAGTQPTAPVWDAFGCLDGGDSLAIHPPSRPSELWPGSGSRTEVTVDIADAAQHLVQVLLWEQGLDPTWPACPEHQGRHPLQATYSSDVTTNSDLPVITTASVASWECSHGSTRITVGELAPPAP